MPIAYDFDSIKNRVVANLAQKEEWSNGLAQGAVTHLIEAIVQEVAYEMQAKEYYTFENWWSLARNKSSLLAEAPSLNYAVPRKIGAEGILEVSSSETFNASHPYNVSIPKYTQFSNGNIPFCAIEDSVLASTDEKVNIVVRQGEAKSCTFTAAGDIFETYTVVDSGVENSLFDLSVNGEAWTAIDNIFNASENEKVYQVYTDPTLSKVILRFGNGSFGKKLESGQTVTFRYISTLGYQGNVTLINSITSVENQLTDTQSNIVDLYCRNPSPISGGQDYPSLEQIRNQGPKIVQAGDRASTLPDFITTINKEASNLITKVNVWGAKEYLEDNNLDRWSFIPTKENVVHIAALGTAPLYENIKGSALETTILDLIYPKCDPTTIITFEDIEKIPLIFNVNAVAQNTSYTPSYLSERITSLLQETYDISNMDFYESIYYSDLMSLIDGITGIRNHLTNITSYKEFSFSEVGTVSRASVTLPLTPIKSSSIKVYIKEGVNGTYIQCAQGNSLDKIVPYGSDFIINGSVNISTGLVSLVATSGTITQNSIIKIVYACDSLDLIITDRKHILDYDSCVITIRNP